MEESDFLIVGAGIVGLTIAWELHKRYPDSRISIIEKEPDVAYHSSGRNSGVLHAGFYYNSESLKARFTKHGNQAMKAFCKEKGLSLNENGKVVVAKNEEEIAGIEKLHERGKLNGVDVSIIDEKELSRLEPNARTTDKALYSPSTATIDPKEISKALRADLSAKGVNIYFNEAYKKLAGKNQIVTKSEQIYQGKKIINTAGLYADKIAKEFGFSGGYTIIPFKGVYLKYMYDNHPVTMNVYPVPNLKNPFLGVHFTVTVNNEVKIGPTSIPAFWRENYYRGNNFNVNEMMSILGWEAKLFLSNAFGFRNLAFDEIKKYRKPYFVNLAAQLIKNIDKSGFKEWSSPGIRAQLLNKQTSELVQDFVVESDTDSVHVLNAVSPAFTSSFPFAEWVVEHHVNK